MNNYGIQLYVFPNSLNRLIDFLTALLARPAGAAEYADCISVEV